MCGIFAAVNGDSVTNNLMAGLKALSNRGYGSAGNVVISKHGLECHRAKGKLGSHNEAVKLARLQRLFITACGTFHYVGMAGKYWLEKLTVIPAYANTASESGYRNTAVDHVSASLFISQLGETADTLATLRDTKQPDQACFSIINVVKRARMLTSHDTW